MTTVTDGFSGTGALSANWTDVSAGLVCSSGQLSGSGYSYWNANTFVGNQTAQIVVKVLPSSEWGAGPMLKYEPGPQDNYYVSYNSARIFVVRISSIVIDVDPTTISVNDIIKLTAETSGSDLVIKLYKNGVEIGSYTDTSPLTGTYIGVRTYTGDATWRADDWEGGDLAGGTAGAAIAYLSQL
jgi:hypothetical protein